jgi:hypothetical protein
MSKRKSHPYLPDDPYDALTLELSEAEVIALMIDNETTGDVEDVHDSRIGTLARVLIEKIDRIHQLVRQVSRGESKFLSPKAETEGSVR